MALSVSFALTWEHAATAEKLQKLADRNAYQAKHQQTECSLKTKALAWPFLIQLLALHTMEVPAW